MAPAKKQKKGAPPFTAAHGGDRKLTRKEKHVINAAKFRVESRRERESILPPIQQKTASGRPKSLQPSDGSKRPTEYDEVLAMQICERFATEIGMRLTEFYTNTSYPTLATWGRWCDAHPMLNAAFTRAREAQMDLQAEEVERWSAEPLMGTITTVRTGVGAHGEVIDVTETRTHDNVERAKLKVDTRKWILAKLHPKKYGTQPLAVEDDSPLKELLTQFRARSKDINGDGT